MKLLRVLVAVLLCAFISTNATFGKGSSKSSGGSVNVKGYTKKDGTRVESHRRSSPNAKKNDNWSTKGNTNPDTGKKGTKPRDGEGK